MDIKTLILGAGAAGMMCAVQAGGDALVIDHAKRPGEKIRISGGGRCNFTNMYAEAGNYLSNNPHFVKSALARYTQWDFIALMDKYDIAWHEKTLGQLFCDGKATQVIDMLLREMEKARAQLWLDTSVISVARDGEGFVTELEYGDKRVQVRSRNLVLATGGKSIPKMGATGLAYDLAQQFGLRVTDTRPALVPFIFGEGRFASLSGVAAPARVGNDRTSFDEAVLFTHRGLSGPAVLQISSYWREGEPVQVNLDPDERLFDALRDQRQAEGRRDFSTELARLLPARLVEFLAADLGLSGRLADQSDARLREVVTALKNWSLIPTGSEGYRTAEVTLGGVNTDDLSSKTLESKSVTGLYVIGEAVDVTGWLGGYNFQWAWSSGHAAGQAIASS